MKIRLLIWFWSQSTSCPAASLVRLCRHSLVFLTTGAPLADKNTSSEQLTIKYGRNQLTVKSSATSLLRLSGSNSHRNSSEEFRLLNIPVLNVSQLKLVCFTTIRLSLLSTYVYIPVQ